MLRRSRRLRKGVGALWKGALEDEVARATRSGASLSLLLVELEDAERVMAVEGRLGAGATLGQFARAVRSAVRRGDILACESDTRAWIIATNTGRLGAQALADRVAAAVRASEPWQGAPLGVSAGIAVFREDGTDVSDLIETAEEARFAAEASGVAVIRDREPRGWSHGASRTSIRRVRAADGRGGATSAAMRRRCGRCPACRASARSPG